MARRKAKKASKGSKRSAATDDLVKVDIYYIPAQQAGMYQVLRTAVKEELQALLEGRFDYVTLIQDEEAGEGLVAYDAAGEEQFRYYLAPGNISQAQRARDNNHLERYLEALLGQW